MLIEKYIAKIVNQVLLSGDYFKNYKHFTTNCHFIRNICNFLSKFNQYRVHID